jgi:hypothetical protein
MSEARENALFEFPRIRVAGFEHVAAVVRLDHDRRAAAQLFGDQGRDVTEVHHGGDLHAVVSCSEAEIVDSIVRKSERMKIDLANAKVFARLDLFDAIAERTSAATRFFSVYIETFADVSIEGLGKPPA